MAQQTVLAPITTTTTPGLDSPVVLRLRPVLDLTDDQLLGLSSLNDDLRLEWTAEGALEVMSPTGWETGNRSISLSAQMYVWATKDGTGVASDSSTGFRLPNGAVRSPDVCWVRRERLAALSSEQKRKYIPLCPDFVLELRSPSDTVAKLVAKMNEYMANGARLGWLLDPETRTVQVYRPDQPVQTLTNPEVLGGAPELPGFTLDLRPIWAPAL
ncbi:MAG: Uma2 family endonuclease [Chloroflexia bacterium]|nr:Uma2 family endonuclease [Chloroflexia bacterium]MBA3639879.1 Uma2 family endonuclease [Acidobacteriota bacterium]